MIIEGTESIPLEATKEFKIVYKNPQSFQKTSTESSKKFFKESSKFFNGIFKSLKESSEEFSGVFKYLEAP
jgi:hypothetical protein